jgi:acyl-coenzyme A synthetase/AMP-(fatty) acid ligase
MARIMAHQLGVRRGDVVQLVMPSNSEMYFPVLGAWLLRAVVSPTDPGLTAEVVGHQMRAAGTKLVLCCRATLAKVRQARRPLQGESSVPIVVMDADAGDQLEAGQMEMSLESLLELDDTSKYPSLPPPEAVEDDEPLLIVWSSGTTGRPKGIMHGPKFLFRVLDRSTTNFTKKLQTTCMFHLGGFTAPLSALAAGTQNIFIAGEDLDNDIGLVLKVAEHCKADLITCGSHHLIQLASMDLPAGQEPVTSVQMAVPLGTNVYDGIIEDLRLKFPALMMVLNVFGQSEGGNAVAVSLDQKSLGGVSCPAVQIVAPGAGNTALGPGEVGEITYRSECAMVGYLDCPEETRHFFGEDGFCRSGDLGHYDEEGTLYYDSRLKELIKYKNFHLYPNELEELLLQHEAVEDAAVFGRPEPAVQELVTALVVRKEGSLVVTGEHLRDMVDAVVDDHKKLRGGVHFVARIPRNPQGKILRQSLLNLLTS